MKLIKIFLSLMIFAVSAAFSFTLAQSPPKPVFIKIKAEKIQPVAPMKATVTNFYGSDCLVLYETNQTDLFPTGGRSIVRFDESYFMARTGISKYFRFKPVYFVRFNFSFV